MVKHEHDDHNVPDGVRAAELSNRDGKALQAKLDELILFSQAANKFVGIEKPDEKELREMSETLAKESVCVALRAD